MESSSEQPMETRAPHRSGTPDPSAPARGGRERFLAACHGEPVVPVPIWLMRQAGRYLPEYREVRRGVDFLTLCKSPDLAAEVTLQPIRRFGMDAAILFSDIMVPVETMGLGLTFDPGPVVDPPLRTRADIERLRVPEDADGLDYVIDAVQRIRRALDEHAAAEAAAAAQTGAAAAQAGAAAGPTDPRRALIGFAGAPVTLATYMCEGRVQKQFTRLRALMHADPGATHTLLERLARVVTGYLRAQIEAGCDCVQLFDTWSGLLDPFDFEAFVQPHVRAIFDALRPCGVPMIYFCRDASSQIERLADIGADVIGLDWRVDVARARRSLAPHAIQGNLDPVLLLEDPDLMATRAARILAAGGGAGHVFNLGHGVLPSTPPEHVARLVETVRAWRPAARGTAAAAGAPESASMDPTTNPTTPAPGTATATPAE
ncbi:MAG: uroporphyrinogen decarboxylase, partial [Candidatus Eiseniibacteriota bacterium]